MQTLEFAVIPPHLRPYIGTIYSGVAEPGPTQLPALMAQLWICTFPVFWQPPGQRTLQRLPSVVLMGPILGSHTVFVPERGLILGVGFWPRGWAELVRVPASQMADTFVDATAIWPQLCAELLNRCEPACDWNRKALALANFCSLLVRSNRVEREHNLVSAVDWWLRESRCLDDLSSALNLSVRQIERKVKETHGASPRLLRSRQRALRAAALSTEPSGTILPWSEYADQSHFIRDFRRFIGGTPRTFSDHSISYSMFSKQWNGDPDHPLALCPSSTSRFKVEAAAVVQESL